jgi:hypothetical protein
MAYKFQRGEAILSGALLQEGDIEIESGFSLKIGNAEMSEADLEQLDGLTAGTVAASKAIVVDANKDFSGLRNATATGAITAGTSFIIGSADLNEADMELIDGLTAGTVAASKAVTVDSNKDTSGFRNVTATGAITAGTSFVIGSADLNEADMEKLDGITNGTVAASKAVVVDANKDASGFRKISISASAGTDGDELIIGSSTTRTLGVVMDGGDDFLRLGNSGGAVVLSGSEGVEFVGGSEGVGSFGSDIKVYATQAGSTTNISLGANGVISGSSKLEIGGTVRLDGVAAAVAAAADLVYFRDADDNLVKSDSFSDVRDNLVFASVSGDIAIASGGAATIQADAVESGMLNDNVISGQTELAADGLAAADELLISDGGTLKKIGVDNLFLDGPGLLAEAAVTVADDYIMFLDGGATGDAKKESVADLATAFAGDGLVASSGVLAVQVSGAVKLASDKVGLSGSVAGNGLAFKGGADSISALEVDLAEFSAGAIASGDSFAFIDSDDSDSMKKETVDDLATLFAGTGLAAASAVLSLDLNELSAAAVNVANDSIAIIDADDSNGSKKESIADLVSAMAGAGLTATSGVLSVSGNDVHSKADGDTLQEGYNYFAALDTSGNSATVTLPGSPENGDVVHVKAGALTNDAIITINRAGSQTIDGETSIALESTFAAVSLVYVGSDAWRIV